MSYSLCLKLVTSGLRLGILLVIFIKSTVEEDGSREVSNNGVVVGLLGLVIEVICAQRLEVVGCDDRDANLCLLVINELREPCISRT